jgi:hypothetical protein
MEIIKNIGLIKGLLSESQIEKLEKHAYHFEERSRIQFTISEITEGKIIVVVSQGTTKKTYVALPKELTKITKSLFGLYLPDLQVEVNFGQFQEPTRILTKPVRIQKTVAPVDIRDRLIDPVTTFNGKSVIENRKLIEGFLTLPKLQKMEKHAQFFQDRSQIVFKVVEVKDPDILVSVRQVDPRITNMVRPQELQTICKSFFEFYLDDKLIHLPSNDSRPFKKVPVSQEWVLKQIKEKGITVDQIVDETGLNPVTLHAWFDGRQSMSTLAKAMFYYMLK